MNILAIDYGQKRIGLAVWKEEADVVMPYGEFQIEDFRLKIGDVTRREKIDLIILGLPLGLDGKENKNTHRVREFGEALKQATGVPVEFVDERFTTAEARRNLGGVSADERAAMLILEAYLQKHDS